MEEIWKVWKDNRGKGRGCFKGALWEVSNFGRVKKNGCLFECKPNPYSGYLQAAGNYVHKLVALLFIPNPENKSQVDHIDTNKLNNQVDNLRWVTPSENLLNPITRYRCSESKKGQQLSEETKRKLSEAHKGKSSWNKGVPMSAEAKHKLSESRLGKHWYKDPITGKHIYYE